MKYTIEVSREDVDRLMVDDLQHVYKWHLKDEDKIELLNSIEVLLAYYMKPSEFSAWFVARGRE